MTGGIVFVVNKRHNSQLYLKESNIERIRSRLDMVKAIFKRSKNSKRENSCISGDKGIILPYIGNQSISGRRETSYPQQPGSYHSGGGRKKGEKGPEF